MPLKLVASLRVPFCADIAAVGAEAERGADNQMIRHAHVDARRQARRW